MSRVFEEGASIIPDSLTGIYGVKFVPPAIPDMAVSRHALLERALASNARLITVIGPGGSGKSMFAAELFAEYAAQENSHACWMHVDAYDDGLPFWLYLCESIRLAHPDQDFSWIEQHSDSILPWINILINQLARLDGITTLFIDNYHLIHSREVSHELNQLITYLPASIRVVVISREPLPFSIAKMRISGQLLEIDENDLAFSYDETRICLEASGKHPGRSAVWECYSITQGWVAGVKIMALSDAWSDSQGKDRSFTSSEDLFAFFSEEVLDSLDPRASQLLIRTSFLSETSGALCDFALEQEGSAQVLDSVSRLGLFISELGGTEGWYRLHPLLRDVLLARLKETEPEFLKRAAARAGEWFVNQGSLARALPCLALAKDYDRLLEVAELNLSNTGFRSSSSSATLSLLADVPPHKFRDHPAIAMAYAVSMFHLGSVGDLDTFMLDEIEIFGEGGLAAAPDEDSLHIVRALSAYGRLDYAAAHEELGKASATCPDSMFSLAGLLHFLDARCLTGLGRWEAAEDALRLTARNAHDHQMGEEYLITMGELSRIQAAQGKIREAEATIRSALQYATRHGLECDATDFARCSLAFAHREMGNIETFMGIVDEMHDFIARQAQEFSGWLYAPDFFLELARCYTSVRDFDSAAACLRSSKDLIKRHLDIPLLAQQTVIARLLIWLNQGDIERIESWSAAHEARVFTSTAAGARELDVFCKAIALIAADKPARVLGLFSTELPDGSALPLMGHRIDYYIAKAWAHLQLNQLDRARAAMSMALSLGKQGGYRHQFSEWGPWIVPLLDEILATFDAGDDFSAYVSDVRSMSLKVWEHADDVPAWMRQGSHASHAQLSEREREVLRLLVDRKTVNEIAELCHVSRSTAQTHVRNIYSKLGIHSRIEAIQKGQTLLGD